MTFTRTLGTSGSGKFRLNGQWRRFRRRGGTDDRADQQRHARDHHLGHALVGTESSGTLKFGSTTAANVIVTLQNGINLQRAPTARSKSTTILATAADYAVISGRHHPIRLAAPPAFTKTGNGRSGADRGQYLQRHHDDYRRRALQAEYRRGIAPVSFLSLNGGVLADQQRDIRHVHRGLWERRAGTFQWTGQAAADSPPGPVR